MFDEVLSSTPPQFTHARGRGIRMAPGGYSGSGRNRPRVTRVRDRPSCRFRQ
jgi:hypothetical protein